MDAKTSIRVIIIRMLIIFLFLSSTYAMVVAEPNNVVPRASKSLVFPWLVACRCYWCKRFHAQLGFIFIQYLCHVCREKQYPARKYCPNENWWEFRGKTFPAWPHTWLNLQLKLIYIIRSNEENKIVTLMVYRLSFFMYNTCNIGWK